MSEDLSIFFSDPFMTVEAVWQPPSGPAQTARVLLDAPDEIILGGQQQATEYSILYPATNFVGLESGDSITVDGAAYRVRLPGAVDDGKLTRVSLSRDFG